MDNTPASPAEEPARAASSWLPIVVALASGLLVVGLMVIILMTPGRGAAGAGAASASSAVQPPANSGLQEAVRIGALAPDFTLPDVAGKSVQLSSFRGVRPVWINFWATWCHFCKTEMPEMHQLYQQYSAQGLEILGVDDQESAAEVQQYTQMGGYDWHFVLDGNGTVDRQYRVTGLPTHIFVDRSGVIKQLIVGGITRPQMESALHLLLTP